MITSELAESTVIQKISKIKEEKREMEKFLSWIVLVDK